MGWWERKTHLPSSHYLRWFFSGSESSLQDCSRKAGVPLWSPLSPGTLAPLLPDPQIHLWDLTAPLSVGAWGILCRLGQKSWTNECYFGPFLITIYLLSKSRGGVFMWVPQLLASSSARNEYLNICTVTSLLEMSYRSAVCSVSVSLRN